MKVSIIIPAHNESKRIARTLENYLAFLSEKKKNKEIADFMIIIVANACKDDTVKIAEKISKKSKEIKILNFEIGGKGFALKEGFKEALKYDFNLIGFVDADMATSPEAFYDLTKNIKNYDGVIASRYIKGSIVKPKQTLMRIIASRVFNFLIHCLFLLPYKDTQCGAKIFKKEVIEEVLPKLSMSQWAFDIDLLYNIRKHGFKIKEFPTNWGDITASKINLKKASVQMFLAILQLRIITLKTKKFFGFLKPFAGFLWRLVR